MLNKITVNYLYFKEIFLEMVKKEFLEEVKNVWFWIYLISLTIIVIIFNTSKQNITINISSLFLLSIIQLIYGSFQIKAYYNETFFEKYISLGYGLFLFVFAIINVAVRVNEIMTALAILFSFFGIVMMIVTKVLFDKLWNSDSLIKIVIFYLLFSFSLNYLFAFGYTIISVPEGNSIVDINDNSIEGARDYILFSYSIYYTSVLEYIPKGYSKLLSTIHVTISYLIHVILLGCIIQRKLVCNY